MHAVHTVGWEACETSANAPAAHAVHTTWLVCVLYVPEVQLVHTVDEVAAGSVL